MSRGPQASGFQPSRDKYKCPVKCCNAEYRGDDIKGHFQKFSNLVALPILLSASIGTRLTLQQKKFDLKDRKEI